MQSIEDGIVLLHLFLLFLTQFPTDHLPVLGVVVVTAENGRVCLRLCKVLERGFQGWQLILFELEFESCEWGHSRFSSFDEELLGGFECFIVAEFFFLFHEHPGILFEGDMAQHYMKSFLLES